jgi:PleD family two-component response regulator/EAL domain-containing protein (putative c-di-GMP-specific phosphodiesterase class I)
MGPSPKLIADFADKAKGVLVETHRLNAGDWESDRVERHQEELGSLGDYAGNLALSQVHAAILDLYAYVSVYAEGIIKPNAAQRAELDRLIQSAQNAVLELAPGPESPSGVVVYLLTPTLKTPSGLSATLRQEGFRLDVFADADDFADALRQSLPQAVIAESSLVGGVSELLDDLATKSPEATRLPLIGVDSGGPSARLESLVGGADLFLVSLDDPTIGSQIKELLSNQSTEPFRVLVVDDDRQMCSYCEAILTRAGMRVETTMDGSTVPDRVRQFKPDLILMDLYLPGVDGLTLTAQLRQQADAVVLPIVFLSGEQSEDARFQAIQVGGDDFLTKPIRPRHLVAAVRSRIKRVRALGRQLSRRPGDARGHLRRGAFLDQLREVKQRPPGAVVALLVVTVDQGPDLQERLSLSAGHELEQAVALRLAQCFEKGDSYCLIQEFGFGVLVERERRDQLLPFAESLRTTLSAQSFKVDGEDTSFSVSIGLALMPRVDRSVDDWIHAAFSAVRTAARLGGNRIEGILSESGGLSPDRLMYIRELLRKGVSIKSMAIDFQPLIPLRGTELGRYAMIVHLRDRRTPLTGIPRADFVPVARELKLQAAIDRLLITHALQALDDQRSRNRVTDLLVPIDFPSIDREQLAWIQAELGRRKQIEQHLTLEFEASFLVESSHAGRLLDRLRTEGVRLGAVERSGRLSHVVELAKLPLKVMRLPAAALQAMQPSMLGPVLETWYRGGRELIAEDAKDLAAISQFWSIGVDYLQGDALAAASPRLDFDFSEIKLS